MRRFVLLSCAIALLAGGCGSSESDVDGNPADSPEHAQQPAKEAEPQTYVEQVTECLREAQYGAANAGDSLVVTNPGDTEIADIALSGRGIATFRPEADQDDKIKVAACMKK